MSDEQGGVDQVIVGLLERATNQIKLATDGATDEQLYYRPTPNANSIAWLVWHLSRLQDLVSSSISGEAQVWYTDRWAERFALPPDLPNDATGWGDSAEQVAAFRVERATLFGYMEAAHRVARERVARLTPAQLEQTVSRGGPRRRRCWVQPGGCSSPSSTTRFSTLDRSTTSAGSSPNQTGVVGRRTPGERRTWDALRSFTRATRRPARRQNLAAEALAARRGCPLTHVADPVAPATPRHDKGPVHVDRVTQGPFPFRKQSEQAPNECETWLSMGVRCCWQLLGLSCRLV